MTLGFVVSIGNSMGEARRSGQLQRLLAVLRHYAVSFERIYYLSYAEERMVDYTDDALLLRKVTILPREKPLPLQTYALLLPWYWRKRLRECDVILVGQAVGAVPAAIARIAFGIPFVVVFGYRYTDFARVAGRRWHALLIRIVEQIAGQMAAAVIARTPELAAYVGCFVSEGKITTIPNGVDTRLFSPAHRPAPNDPPVALFVGRLEPQKNLDALIDALALLKPEFNVRLVLIGEGSLRERLARRAVQADVNVEFVGTVPHEQLPTYLQEADFLVLPSLIEGHPKALLEAMSVGLPCVGTDVPGIRDVLQDGETGVLCPGTDPASLTAGLRRLLADRAAAQELGRHARALIEAEYDLDSLLQREVELLQQVAIREA